MASKQTRRSISVRGTTYDNLREYCQTESRSMSDVVEELLGSLLERKPAASRTVAHKILRKNGSVGRPAPTPAQEVIPARVKAPRGDYRTIRF